MSEKLRTAAKTCHICGNPSGKQNRCKAFHALYMRDWSAKRRRVGIHRDCHSYDATRRDQHAARMKQYRDNPANKVKIQARHAVRTAISSGRLAKAENCALCGNLTKTVADHHNGYEKEHWLDVRWLCTKCDAALEGARRRKT